MEITYIKFICKPFNTFNSTQSLNLSVLHVRNPINYPPVNYIERNGTALINDQLIGL